MKGKFRRFFAIWQYALVFLRPRMREPGELFWAFGFPLMITFIMALAFDSDSKSSDPSRIGYWVETQESIKENWQELETQSSLKLIELPPSLLSHWQEVEARGETSDRFKNLQTFPKEFISFRLDGIWRNGTYFSLHGQSQSDLAYDRLSLALYRLNEKNPVALKKYSLSGGRFMDWFIPGLLGLQAFSWGLWVAQILGDFRNRGFLKRLQLAPFRLADFLGGISLGACIWGSIQFILLLIVFSFYPDVVPVSSYINVLLLLFMISFSSFFLVTFLVSRTFSQPVVMGISNAVFFPSMFMSGVYFKVENFPKPVQDMIEFLPLGAGNRLLRLFYGEGLGWFHTESLYYTCILIGWVIVCGALTLKIYPLSQSK
jgi:ABC-2 type transport system permease protein